MNLVRIVCRGPAHRWERLTVWCPVMRAYRVSSFRRCSRCQVVRAVKEG